MSRCRAGVLFGSVLALGCSAPAPAPSGGPPDAGPPVSGDVCTTPAVPACEDQIIQALNLFKPAAPGPVANVADGYGWRSTVDATAGTPPGGMTPTQSFVYATFTDQGLQKVALGDQDALESMDWDIALRRYVIRLNGSDSGPSCVGAARVPGKPAFDDVSDAPEGIPFRLDDDFTDACTLIDDGSGLGSSPLTALASYYEYKGCVAMTGYVFVVRLRTGRLLKLQVTQYYASGQQACDESGTRGQDSGHVGLRWAFLN